MAINLTSQFSEQAALPLDDRFIFPDTTARDALPALRRHAGMICWVIAEAKHYGLANDLTTWFETSGTVSVDMVGDAGAGGVHGLVPAPAAGDTAAGKYLKADGTWEVPEKFIAAVGGETLRAQYIKYMNRSGYGASAAAIPYFQTLASDVGDALVVHTNNSTVGNTIVASVRCLVTAQYSAYCSRTGPGGLPIPAGFIGFSLNSTQLGTAIYLANGRLTTDVLLPTGTATVTLIMEIGDILRAHGQGGIATSTDILQVTAVDLETAVGVLYVPFVGDTGAGGVEGLVHAPAAGDDVKFLKGDGTWSLTPTTLPLITGPFPPTLATAIPTDSPMLFYDTSSVASGFVSLWLYSTALADWYPIRTAYSVKHLLEDLDITEILTKLRLRTILEGIDITELLIQKRLRTLTEGIDITENLVLLVIVGMTAEINGAAINGAPL